MRQGRPNGGDGRDLALMQLFQRARCVPLVEIGEGGVRIFGFHGLILIPARLN